MTLVIGEPLHHMYDTHVTNPRPRGLEQQADGQSAADADQQSHHGLKSLVALGIISGKQLLLGGLDDKPESQHHEPGQNAGKQTEPGHDGYLVLAG